MLSYQHIYHAGNHADCHKHSLQAALLEYLRKDKSPFLYLDTHSARGLYNLATGETQKLQEYLSGIHKLWPLSNWPREAAPYRRVVESLNRGKDVIQFYPGSPWVAEALRRPQDKMELYELHPREFKALENNMRMLGNLKLHHADGWDALKQKPSLPRGLIMIDPSYELKHEYSDMAKRMTVLMQTHPDFIVTIWYPILAADRHTAMTDALTQMPHAHIKSEIVFDTDKGMNGSGLFIVNPPANFAQIEQTILNWLRRAL